MNRLLLVEDEERIASFLQKGLRSNGYSTSVATTGEDALAMVGTGDFDLMVLEIGLPDIDGFEVLRRFRQRNTRTPVVILTARDAVEDRIAGLETGADDYVPKPFSFDELLARIRARLREDRTPEQTVLTVGDATLDLRTRRLSAGGKTQELSAREFSMAEIFFRHPGQVLTREQLLSNVWGYDYDPGSNVVDVYIGYLRKKLGKRRIKTLRGIGYRLEAADDDPGDSP
jgi:DNA-binding response OmpR family regulator